MPKGLIHCPLTQTELSRLLPEYTPCLLPLGNKPLLEYYLNFFHLFEINEIHMIIYDHQPEIQNYFKQGELWSVHLHYHTGQTDEKWQNYLQNSDLSNDAEWLVIDGLQFIYFDQHKTHPPIILPDGIDGYCLSSDIESKSQIFWLKAQALTSESRSFQLHPNLTFESEELSSLKTYFELNQALFDRLKDQYILPGFSNETGAYLGINVSIASGAQIEKPVMIGNHCRIEKQAHLAGNVILGNHVIIDRGTEINHALILPNSYVGPDLFIEHKIVNRHRLIDPETGVYIDISDDFILSQVNLNIFYLIAKRLLGLVLLLPLLCLQLPLYLILARWIESQNLVYYLNPSLQVIHLKTFNKPEQANLAERIFFSVSLHKIPFLWAALRGKLYFAGNRILTAEQKNQRLLNDLDTYTPGVFSYSEMLVSSPEQSWIDEEYYNHHQSLRLDFKILINTLIQNLF